MTKPTFALAKTKTNIRFAELISAFDFTTRKVHFLNFLKPKFPASSHIHSVIVQLDLCQTCSKTTSLVVS